MTERRRAAFPKGGLDWDALATQMRERTSKDADWHGGRTSIFFFMADEETYQIGKKAFFEYFSLNALGNGRAYPGLGRMERDVIDYGLDLLSAPASADGLFSTGGTESIFLAMKAARESHRAKKPGRAGRRPNIVMPITGHPAFDKSAIVMDIDIRRAPLDADKRVNVKAMRELIDDDTMTLVGSAPCYPHGVIDPIDEISRMALDAGTWMHVDACVGGWVAPFFRRIGRGTPAFDFAFEGVRSISADLHKFGFCPKPASTLFFRDGEDMRRSRFLLDSWPSGPYLTSTFCGTRPGGAVAAAWAVLNHLGTTGYEETARKLAATVDSYVSGIGAIEGIEFWAKPDVTILNFGANGFDIYAAAEGMMKRGWVCTLTREPRGMHAMLAMQHAPAREQYLADLRECADAARKSAAASDIKASY